MVIQYLRFYFMKKDAINNSTTETYYQKLIVLVVFKIKPVLLILSNVLKKIYQHFWVHLILKQL